jgi:hypothetical protein
MLFLVVHCCRARTTDAPLKPFSLKYQTFGLGQTIWEDEFWCIFGRFIRTHFVAVSLLSMFSINQPLFPQKTEPLNRNPKYLFGIPNIYLGLGFEFGPQRIRDLAIMYQ